MYLDPGFGGMLVQLIVAVAALGGAILFSFRKKIKALFTKNKTEADDSATYSANMTVSDDETIDVLAEKE